jgi:hypothetical protein
MWGCGSATLIDYSSRLWLAVTMDEARREEKAPASEGGRYGLAGANRGPVGGSRRGGEHRLKSVPLEKELDVV